MSRLKQLFAGALVLLAAAHAAAGDFTVTPIKVEFAGMGRSQLLSLTNVGDVPARFLVRSASWTMSESGSVDLAADTSLLVFPASFTIAPKATQNIRVGTAERAAETEKTWRVVLEELPDPAATPGAGASVAVLSIISVPVFLPPVAPRKGMEMKLVSLQGQAATVSLSNTGNQHELVTAVSVTAVRGEGAGQQQQADGWYVLPGKQRVYTLSGPAAWCAPGVTRFDLMASDRQGQALARRSVDASEACR